MVPLHKINGRMYHMEHQITIDRNTAQKLYDFITEHLAVINDAPEVEQFMMYLEDQFDLPTE